MTALLVMAVIFGSIYLFGLIFVIVVAGMQLTDESALKRREAMNQLKRAPFWPIDEARRLRSEGERSRHEANIEQQQRILDQLAHVERMQQRNLETWEKAAQSSDRLRELTQRKETH